MSPFIMRVFGQESAFEISFLSTLTTFRKRIANLINHNYFSRNFYESKEYKSRLKENVGNFSGSNWRPLLETSKKTKGKIIECLQEKLTEKEAESIVRFIYQQLKGSNKTLSFIAHCIFERPFIGHPKTSKREYVLRNKDRLPR